MGFKEGVGVAIGTTDLSSGSTFLVSASHVVPDHVDIFERPLNCFICFLVAL
jgi:hypothetical protein